MARARVYGHNAKIFITTNSLNVSYPLSITIPILGTIGKPQSYNSGGGHVLEVGEFDNFKAAQNTVLKLSRPIGATREASNMVYGGWELDFAGGKVSPGLALLIQATSNALEVGALPPKFLIKHIIKHYDGTTEAFWYPNCVIFRYSQDTTTGQEITESVKGWAPTREIGAGADNTNFGDYANFVKEEITNQVKDLAQNVFEQGFGIIEGLLKI